jgi:hypothetical protein
MKRKAWMLAGAAVTAVTATVAVLATVGRTGNAAAVTDTAPPNTATISQGTLMATVSVPGTLTYGTRVDGSPYSVINQAAGIYTELPSPGQTISQGQVLYRVNDSPVVLLYGSTPAFRDLSSGEAGADVSELNADLVSLGYATPAQLGPSSDSFGEATSAALEMLQTALGESQTGTLTLGQVVFEPVALRVSATDTQPGSSAQPGQSLLQASSTNRQVTVSLDASQQAAVAVGDKVTITLPDNRSTPGIVTAVGTVATCSASSGPGASISAQGTDNCPAGVPGNSSTPAVTVAVTLSDPAATSSWDQAPVQVQITVAAVPNALAVPVTALLARPGGGYVVEVVGTGGATQHVTVSLGLFDAGAGLVQITGSGLAAGQKVVVPAT